MQFGLVPLSFKMKIKPNQSNMVWIGSVVAVFRKTIQFFVFNVKIKLKAKNDLFSTMFQI